jgi:hypothetical protein
MPAVRIAFSGSHRVGKSTLLELVSEALPDHETVTEPFYLLEEEGYEHTDPPSLEDFEAQLERSLDAIAEADDDALFDRCPADVLAYLLVHEDADSFELDDWLPRARAAMKTIDLVVFVPIEEKDRIALPAHEDAEQRLAVHEKLREILVDDSMRFRRQVLVAEGSPEARARRVMKRVERKRDTFDR